MRKIRMEGRRFGKLVVLEEDGSAEDLEEIKGRLSEAALEKEQTRDSHKPEDGGQAGTAVEIFAFKCTPQVGAGVEH